MNATKLNQIGRSAGLRIYRAQTCTVRPATSMHDDDRRRRGIDEMAHVAKRSKRKQKRRKVGTDFGVAWIEFQVPEKMPDDLR